MSTASTAVFLYIGFDEARRDNKGAYPECEGGHIGRVDWIEEMAVELGKVYDKEFADLNLACVFDYEITETVGYWLYQNPSCSKDDMVTHARFLTSCSALSESMSNATR